MLFLGDILFLTGALWLSLYLRAFEVPTKEAFVTHLLPFSILFVVWISVFTIAGLYESRSIILARRALSATLFVSQLINVLLAALFFFFIPFFGITPKTLLLIYLVVSFLLILLWRVVLFPRLGERQEAAIVVGEGTEVEELVLALHAAPYAPARVVERISPTAISLAGVIESALKKHNAPFVIADFSDNKVAAAFPKLYNFLFRGIRFFDAPALYEEVFGRISLSRIDDRWLARNVSRYAHTLYDTLKRFMDIAGGIALGVISLVLYPFIAVAILIEDGFPVFIMQERVGQDGKLMQIYKFRSMSGNDSGRYQNGSSALAITRVGKVLRTTRLDELPQLWSVVTGSLSLIGPRPEFPSLVALYEKEIPYYGVRHLVRPGLSGWAQLYHDNHPHHEAAVAQTREKLSYDLYYLKHRSLMLDATIALKTIKKLLTRSGV